MKLMPILGVLILTSCVLQAEDAKDVLAHFSEKWPQDRVPYRTENDASWKVYANTLRQLVSLNDKAIPALIAGCDDKNAQVRALCARVLGVVQAKDALPKLIALLDDPQPYVALLAADALGQFQDSTGIQALEKARMRLKNGDVLLHISKTLERKTPLEKNLAEAVLKLEENKLDSAVVDKPAPDFTLQDSDGTDWALSQFKGKKQVVLIFLYGDG